MHAIYMLLFKALGGVVVVDLSQSSGDWTAPERNTSYTAKTRKVSYTAAERNTSYTLDDRD